MTVVINIVLILASLVLIVAVLMQEGNKQGLGAIGGAAETFLGKNKSKGYEGKLLLITKITAGVFVVLAILLTWLNSQTYSVRYFVDGKEYYPEVEAMIAMNELEAMQSGTYLDDAAKNSLRESIISEASEESLVKSYVYGADISPMPVPEKEGYEGHWDIELPKKMGRTNYTLNAIYEEGTYKLVFMADGEKLSEGEFVYNTPITLEAPEIPAKEGLEAAWDIEVPEKMPGYHLTITAVYTDPHADHDHSDATPSDATPEEAPIEPTLNDTSGEATSSEPETNEG